VNRFRRNTGLTSAFRFRLLRHIERAEMTDQQRIDLRNAVYDEAFIDELGNETIRLYGEPRGGVFDGLREWLAKVDWLKIIQIALTLLLIFLDEEEPA
jgi:hypothetical protein